MSEPAPPAIRRILVALDASAGSVGALRAAAAVAAAASAELAALYVEDVNLLRLAALPFAAEVDPISGRARPLQPEDMERLLRVQALRARQAFVQATARLRASCSFRVARGRIVPELLQAAMEADLVALGAIGSLSAARGGALGSIARAVIAEAERPLLILPHGAALRPPIAVAVDAASGARGALALGARLNDYFPSAELVVLLIADDPKQAQALRGAAETVLAGTRTRYRRVAGADVDALGRTLQAERAGTLVLARASRHLSVEAVGEVLARTNVAVLLV
ncbi:MAG TPA: universal stress protein [Burkholderiales bacterium]